MTTPHAKLADQIVVRRKPGERAYSIEVDGEPMPWATAGDVGATVVTALDAMPMVTIALLAKTIRVEDDVYADAELLEHEGDGES